MMTLSVYIGVATVLFIIGILFVVRGISSEEQDAVPISNPEEIRNLKRAFNAGEQTPKEQFEKQADSVPSSKIEMRDVARTDPFKVENERLKEEIARYKNECERLKNDVESTKQKYTHMQEQSVQSKLEQDQLRENNKLLDELKEKTEMLERQYNESQKQQDELKVVIGRLKEEKDVLVDQARQKEEQAAEQLRKERDALRETELAATNKKLVETISALEDIKRENKALQKANMDLKDEFSKIEELNKNLMSKEKLMQYELTKNRAQALGLEKICEGFRTQIEMMSESEAIEA